MATGSLINVKLANTTLADHEQHLVRSTRNPSFGISHASQLQLIPAVAHIYFADVTITLDLLTIYSYT